MGGAVELSERQKDILGLIYANSKITYRQLAQRLEINDSAVMKHIKRKRCTKTNWRNARSLGNHR
jgi:ATP-dependent DNA helicase RecG